MKISLEKQLNPVLESKKGIGSSIAQILLATVNMTIREYKKETPVDKGILRSSVKRVGNQINESNLSYSVSATAKNRGFLYAVAVHEGTYDFRGDKKDYGGMGRAGAMRGRGVAGRGGFSYVDQSSGRKGIRPNRFALRAGRKLETPITKFVSTEITKLLNKTR